VPRPCGVHAEDPVTPDNDLPTLLCSPERLMAHRREHPPGTPGAWRVFDCSFDLVDTAAGERAFAAARLPGSTYLHLDRDLSAPKVPDPATGRDPRGRHPLPDRTALALRLGALGVTPGTVVIAADRQGGMFAGRLWWLLKWLGHEAVAVLDGGIPAWQAAGGEMDSDEVPPPPAAGGHPYPVDRPPLVRTVDSGDLLAGLGRLRVVDARAAERFRGDVEPLDPVAGHVPGALNRPFASNLGPDGRFKPAGTLRAEWAALIGADPQVAGPDAVHHCGSGVTACHNLVAQAVAGFGIGVLYSGSWSAWCADPSRPVARGG
jgi:thiosulfate/3-mercaptopyruvate sulfurtransferase